MIEEEQRPRYWLYTLLVIGGIVSLSLVSVLVLPLFAPDMNANSLLGFPLGYYFAAQGAIIILIVAVNWVVGRQGDIDRKFGAIEDL